MLLIWAYLRRDARRCDPPRRDPPRHKFWGSVSDRENFADYEPSPAAAAEAVAEAMALSTISGGSPGAYISGCHRRMLPAHDAYLSV